MLQCVETVTVIKCDGETYTLYPFENCSWFDKTKVKLQESGLAFANAVTVRIPAASVGDTLPDVGDHIVKGTCASAPTTPKELAAYHPRKIMAVGDNRRGGLPHVVVVAQ